MFIFVYMFSMCIQRAEGNCWSPGPLHLLFEPRSHMCWELDYLGKVGQAAGFLRPTCLSSHLQSYYCLGFYMGPGGPNLTPYAYEAVI